MGEGAIDEWKETGGITEGSLFQSINKTGRVWGTGMTPKVLWEVVRAAAKRAGIEKLAPHDLRRSCARLCHLAGGELDQIQFLLGHVSIQTTERYLGGKQKLRFAVNDSNGHRAGRCPSFAVVPSVDRPLLRDQGRSVVTRAIFRATLRE